MFEESSSLFNSCENTAQTFEEKYYTIFPIEEKSKQKENFLEADEETYQLLVNKTTSMNTHSSNINFSHSENESYSKVNSIENQVLFEDNTTTKKFTGKIFTKQNFVVMQIEVSKKHNVFYDLEFSSVLNLEPLLKKIKNHFLYYVEDFLVKRIFWGLEKRTVREFLKLGKEFMRKVNLASGMQFLRSTLWDLYSKGRSQIILDEILSGLSEEEIYFLTNTTFKKFYEESYLVYGLEEQAGKLKKVKKEKFNTALRELFIRFSREGFMKYYEDCRPNKREKEKNEKRKKKGEKKENAGQTCDLEENVNSPLIPNQPNVNSQMSLQTNSSFSISFSNSSNTIDVPMDPDEFFSFYDRETQMSTDGGFQDHTLDFLFNNQ